MDVVHIALALLDDLFFFPGSYFQEIFGTEFPQVTAEGGVVFYNQAGSVDISQDHGRVEDLHVAGCIEVTLAVAIYNNLFREHIALDGGMWPNDQLSALDDMAVKLAFDPT